MNNKRLTNFIFFSCIIFFFFKILSISLTNFDFFGDEAQYWIWSKDLDFGYYSKPPLLPWLISLVSKVFGNDFFTIKMIPVFIYLVTSYVVFLISKKLVNDSGLAFLTSLTFFLMPAVTFSSFIVSTDITLILFWSLSLLQILITKEKPSFFNFALLGMFVGLAFLSKYAAIYFVISMLLLLFEKNMRDIFLKNKISLIGFTVVFIFVIAPNILWNINNKWITLQHTISNAALERVNINILEPLEFLISQIFMIGPIVLFFFVFRFYGVLKNDFNTKFLLIFSLPVFLIILAEAIFVRANANWAAVSLVSFIILFVHTIYKINFKILFINNLLNLLFGLFFFFLIAISFDRAPFNRVHGITNFANLVSEIDQVKVNNTIVIDNRMLFANFKYILQNRNINLYAPWFPGKKVGHHFQISNPLDPNFNKNFIFIGYLSQLEYLNYSYDAVLVGSFDVQFENKPIKIYEISF